MENLGDIDGVLKELAGVHYTTGPLHQRAERLKAQKCMKSNELEAIHHLVESHVPSLRMKAELSYEKNLAKKNANFTLCKNSVSRGCAFEKDSESVGRMLHKVMDMPPEWVLVQLTPHFNAKENTNIFLDKHHTNSLYVSVFHCGPSQPQPFCVNVETPRDPVDGSIVQLKSEMLSIMRANTETLTSFKKQTHFAGEPQKKNYFASRSSIDSRLKELVKALQHMYLKEWRCFLIGKYVNKDVEEKVSRKINDYFKNDVLDEKSLNILLYLVKSVHCLKTTELMSGIRYLFPENKALWKDVMQFVANTAQEFQLHKEKRHPVMLILDDSLDCFPWEMMDILSDASVSRLPSLHIAYALYQEHKSSIRDGFKVVENPKNGSYVINPDLDLKNMQNRILSFYEYWLPEWKGVAGQKPAKEEFENMLTTSDIYAYSGHGSGAHWFAYEKLEKIRIKAVVLLFGCSSTKLSVIGPQCESYSPYQIYLIACSPCIVGNLWEVTDLDTDILTTHLFSYWIPNKSVTHWGNLDKTKWRKGERVTFKSSSTNDAPSEPELLRCLSNAKKSNVLSFYVTKAAIVARGIPVKIG